MEPILNSQLPEFSVQAFQNGAFKTVTNNDLKGKWAILFFYPADFTFVCPTELVDMAEKYDLSLIHIYGWFLCHLAIGRRNAEYPFKQVGGALRWLLFLSAFCS